MNHTQQSYFGEGPKIFRPTILWALVAIGMRWLWPDVFHISNTTAQMISIPLGWAFIALGATLYFWGLLHMIRAVKSGQLDTTGPFSLVRHPMYSAWILMIFPGISLVSGAWLMWGSPVIAWLFFRQWVKAEEQKLTELFGPAYLAYRDNTHQLIPFFPVRH